MTLTLTNCQKEDDASLSLEAQQENNQDAQITSKIVSGADIPDIISFVKSKSSPSLTFKFGEPNYAAAPEGGGTINHEDNLTITQAMTDEIVTITQYSKTNYAFDMPTNDPDYFLNLIVVEHTAGDYMYFVKYVPNSETFWDGTDIDTFEGVKYIYSDTGVYRTKTLHSNGSMGTYPCECPDDGNGGGGRTCGPDTWWRCNLWGYLHQFQSECNCGKAGKPACTGFSPVSVTVCSDIPDTSVQGSGVNYTSDSCYCWDDDEDWIDNDNSGGQGSGGGSDPVNNCPGVQPCGNELMSLDENCECAYDSNPITPVNVNVSTNPCKELNILSKNAAIGQNLKTLMVSNNNYEEGFKIRTNPNNGGATEPTNIGNSNTDCSEVKLFPDSYTFAAAHSHPQSCDLYGMFSGSDVLFLAKMAKAYNNGINPKFNEFAFMMTYNGKAFALKFDDNVALNELIAIYDDTEKRKKFMDDIKKKYERRDRYLGYNATTNDFQKELLKYLKNKNLDVSLHQAVTDANNNVTNWERKSLNTNNQVETTPCI